MKKKGRGKAPTVDSRAADANRYSCLSAQEFERLIVAILQEEAFRDVEWHGEKGNDVGRDVICRREWMVGTKTISEKFSVQCKRYASSVPWVTLETDLAKSAFHKPDVVLIAMSCTLSPRTKEWVERAENERGFRIVLWERSDLDHLLRRHQVVRRTFFGDPQDDPFTVSHLAKLCRAPEIADVAWESASLTAVRSVLAVGEGIERAASAGDLLVSSLADSTVTSMFDVAGIRARALAGVITDLFLNAQNNPRKSRGGALQMSARRQLEFFIGDN